MKPSLIIIFHPPIDSIFQFRVAKIKLRVLKTKPVFPKLKTSAKSVQTSAEVCADYTCSLYRLQLKSPESTTYLHI